MSIYENTEKSKRESQCRVTMFGVQGDAAGPERQRPTESNGGGRRAAPNARTGAPNITTHTNFIIETIPQHKGNNQMNSYR